MKITKAYHTIELSTLNIIVTITIVVGVKGVMKTVVIMVTGA